MTPGKRKLQCATWDNTTCVATRLSHDTSTFIQQALSGTDRRPFCHFRTQIVVCKFGRECSVRPDFTLSLRAKLATSLDLRCRQWITAIWHHHVDFLSLSHPCDKWGANCGVRPHCSARIREPYLTDVSRVFSWMCANLCVNLFPYGDKFTIPGGRCSACSMLMGGFCIASQLGH